MAESPSVPLPSAVLMRTKTGFSIPTQNWLSHADGSVGSPRGLRGWANRVYDQFMTTTGT